MSPDLIIQGQKQIKDYVLFRNCEQRFTKMGEDYLMRIGFRMMELIRANPMRRTEGEYTVYCAAHMGIDTDALAYFALSVIWRGGAHIWRTFGAGRRAVFSEATTGSGFVGISSAQTRILRESS
jgi:hypothetical protein